MPFHSYECTNAHCRHENVEFFATKCGKKAERSLRHEQGHMRQGDLKDWESDHAGVQPFQAERANRMPEYVKLGVHFDKTGKAHVPGNNRRAFLHERGMCDLK
jgi:hypothetical protein